MSWDVKYLKRKAELTSEYADEKSEMRTLRRMMAVTTFQLSQWCQRWQEPVQRSRRDSQVVQNKTGWAALPKEIKYPKQMIGIQSITLKRTFQNSETCKCNRVRDRENVIGNVIIVTQTMSAQAHLQSANATNQGYSF